MLNDLLWLVETYGYVAIAIGCFFEGETMLLLGSLAAQQGILWFPGVVAASFIGTLIGDNAWFYLGRHLGQPFIARHRHWRVRARYAGRQLERYGTMFIAGLRFFYGLRSVTPFALGAAHVSPVKFFVFDLLGTVVWLIVMATAAYFLGAAVVSALTAIHGKSGALLLAVVGLSLFAVFAGLFAWRLRVVHKTGDK